MSVGTVLVPINTTQTPQPRPTIPCKLAALPSRKQMQPTTHRRHISSKSRTTATRCKCGTAADASRQCITVPYSMQCIQTSDQTALVHLCRHFLLPIHPNPPQAPLPLPCHPPRNHHPGQLQAAEVAAAESICGTAAVASGNKGMAAPRRVCRHCPPVQHPSEPLSPALPTLTKPPPCQAASSH